MKRKSLIDKIQKRRNKMGISIDNLAKLSQVGRRTIQRFLSDQDVNFSVVEKITNTLGLDFSGNETVNIKTLKKQRARDKALILTSIIQSTSALENQGLDKKEINSLFKEIESELLHGKYKKNLWVK